MRLKSEEIIGIRITVNSMNEILEYIKRDMMKSPNTAASEGMKTGNCTMIVTPNPEQLVISQRFGWFADMLNHADLAVPDGIGVILAARILGLKGLRRRVTGIDLMQELISIAEKQRVPIALIGGKGEIAVKALDRLHIIYPNLSGFAADGPEMTVSEIGDPQYAPSYIFSATDQSGKHFKSRAHIDPTEAVCQLVSEKSIRMVFVGMGAPKQEAFIMGLSRRLNTMRLNARVVLMAVGGSFDILSGLTPRAPSAIRSVGLEWLWRLILEPWRILRQLRLPIFIWYVVLQRMALFVVKRTPARNR